MTVAIRAEPPALEKASVRVVQIDEAPLQKGAAIGESQCVRDLRRAAESFRIASNGVADEPPIYTHTSYTKCNSIIADRGAGVITI